MMVFPTCENVADHTSASCHHTSPTPIQHIKSIDAQKNDPVLEDESLVYKPPSWVGVRISHVARGC
jgi:hypothetical protein